MMSRKRKTKGTFWLRSSAIINSLNSSLFFRLSKLNLKIKFVAVCLVSIDEIKSNKKIV